MRLVSAGHLIKSVTQDCMGSASHQSIGVSLPSFTLSSTDTTLPPGQYAAEVHVTLGFLSYYTGNLIMVTIDPITPNVAINWSNTCTQAQNQAFTGTSSDTGARIDLWPCTTMSTDHGVDHDLVNYIYTSDAIYASFRNRPDKISNNGSSYSFVACDVYVQIDSGPQQDVGCIQGAFNRSIGTLLYYQEQTYTPDMTGFDVLTAQVVLTYAHNGTYIYLSSPVETRYALYPGSNF